MAELSDISFGGWEKLLVDHFLIKRADEHDLQDIRAFEINGETLAAACNLPSARANDAIAAFRKMIVSARGLRTALKDGKRLLENSPVPGCFCYLALTLLVDSDLEGDYADGNFRHKLAAWLGDGSTFGMLSGVNRMWIRLAAWLEAKADAGLPYRRLRLPDIPDGWNQIGYSRYLSFPAKRDVTLLLKLLDSDQNALNSPQKLINQIEPLLQKEKVSSGLKLAFADFAAMFFQGIRGLGQHRFWMLLERVQRIVEPKHRYEAQVEMAVDGEERLFLPSIGFGETEAALNTLGEALSLAGVRSSANLGPAIARGLLFFRNYGTAVWQAEPNLSACRGRVFVAIADERRHLLGSKLGLLSQSGTWWLTGASVQIGRAEDALENFKRVVGLSDQISKPRLTDGVRTAGFWLGRPKFLPYLESDFDNYGVRQIDGTASELEIDAGRLRSDKNLDGDFYLDPLDNTGSDVSALRVAARFVSNAFVHDHSVGSRRNLPLLIDWKAVMRPEERAASPNSLDWERVDKDVSDLLEALYADGEYGWEEAALLHLIGRVATEKESWQLLRCLSDAGIIQPRLRSRWRGRVWTLRPPSLLQMDGQEDGVIVVEGATCEKLQDRFCSIVDAAGGRNFRVGSLLKGAPPVWGCSGVSAKQLADLLTWETHRFTRPSKVPLAFADTQRIGTNYEVATTWNWDMQRFSRVGGDCNGVVLERRTHPGAIDHDLYSVSFNGGNRNFLSRNAAVLFAHATARKPMFHWADGTLCRLTTEGGLPDALAEYARRSEFQAAGFRGTNYSFPASLGLARYLAELLPFCISGVSIPGLQRNTPAHIVQESRRRMSALQRPLWKDGRLSSLDNFMEGRT